jgi:hypothetical protein
MTDVRTQEHYAKYEIEPIEYLNSLLTDDELRGYYWATALVYLSRFKDKGGREDLAKAKVYLELLDDLMMWQESGMKRPSGNPIYRIYPGLRIKEEDVQNPTGFYINLDDSVGGRFEYNQATGEWVLKEMGANGPRE